MHLRIRSRVVALAATLALLTPGLPAVVQATHIVIPAVGAHPRPVQITPLAAKVGCQNIRPGRLQCYSPQQIYTAYGFDKVFAKGITGKGRTIVIVDAFQSPTIASDLASFDALFGLNAPPSFVQIAPDGLTPFDITSNNQVGWSAEISLDVQWAHAIAPNANIVLDLAKSNDDADILSATKYAVDHNLGDVISQSFGEAESCVDSSLLSQEHKLFEKATLKGITLVASSGDDGAAQPTCDNSSYILSASSPASDPLVLAVGGTNLVAGPEGCSSTAPPDPVNLIPCPPPFNVPSGQYISENAWNDASAGPAFGDPAHGYSGGGFSNLYSRPFYQLGTRGTRSGHRGVPDVAYDAGLAGGVVVFWGVGGGAFIFGGTSSGSPQWSGLVALADQAAHHRVGFINPILYGLAHFPSLYSKTFHDINSGNNNFTPDGVLEIAGYHAVNGWDPVTGLGTPKADALIVSNMH